MGHPSRLPWSQRLSYGVGHSLNDFTASMWFSYLIVYLQLVLGFDPNYAGFILLVGQVADAIATPLLGYEISNMEGGKFCKKYGKRKFLHLIGTVAVILSFPFVFSVCPGCENASEFAYTVMLVPVVIIFQFGWAAVQISHLSLIPVITPHETERDFLNVLRYSVDTMSDIATYIVVWCVFDLTREPIGNQAITGEYANKFMIIVITITAIGTFFSLIFHLGVKEDQGIPDSSLEGNLDEGTNIPNDNQNDSLLSTTITSRGWFKEIYFYEVGILYTCVRLYQNMSSIFMSLYLQESLKANDDFIAKIPFVMNVSGFVISCALPKFFKVFGKKVTFLGGLCMGVGSCLWIAVGHGDSFCSKGIYGVGVLMGAGSSVMVISSLSLIHDLIGTSIASGAFVYGCMSFFDKLSNGIAAMVVQYVHSVVSCDKCDWFYRDVMSYGVGATAIVASIILVLLLPANLAQRRSVNNGTGPFSNEAIAKYESIENPGETEPLLNKETSTET